MKLLKNKVMALALAVVMGVATVVGTPISADAAGAKVTLGTVEAKTGDEVVVDVVMSGNPGIIGATIEYDFDETALEFVGVANTELLSGEFLGTKDALLWDNTLATEGEVVNGVIAKITFKVLAAEGTTNAVTLTKVECIDASVELVDFETVDGAVVVSCTHDKAVWQTKTEATCGTDGVKELVCPKCGVIDEEVIPATGNHTWNEGEVTTEATCGTNGVKTYTCTVCGKTKTEVIPATGLHVDENKDCVCDNCKASLDHVDENKDDVCDICGAELKKPVDDDKEEHKHVDANNDGKCDTCGKEIEASKTGDNANVALYAIMMAAAAAVVVYKKRRVEA